MARWVPQEASHGQCYLPCTTPAWDPPGEVLVARPGAVGLVEDLLMGRCELGCKRYGPRLPWAALRARVSRRQWAGPDHSGSD